MNTPFDYLVGASNIVTGVPEPSQTLPVFAAGAAAMGVALLFLKGRSISNAIRFAERVKRMKARHLERLDAIRKENTEWNAWKSLLTKRERNADVKHVLLFLSRLDGTPEEMIRSITDYMTAGPLSYSAVKILRSAIDRLSGKTGQGSMKQPEITALRPYRPNPVERFVLSTYSSMSSFGKWVWHNPWEFASYISLAGVALLGIGVAADAVAGGTAAGALVASGATAAGRALLMLDVPLSAIIVGTKLMKNGSITKEDASNTVISFATSGAGLAVRPVLKAVKPFLMRFKTISRILEAIGNRQKWEQISDKLPRFLRYAGNAIFSELLGKPIRKSLREKNRIRE